MSGLLKGEGQGRWRGIFPLNDMVSRFNGLTRLARLSCLAGLVWCGVSLVCEKIAETEEEQQDVEAERKSMYNKIAIPPRRPLPKVTDSRKKSDFADSSAPIDDSQASTDSLGEALPRVAVSGSEVIVCLYYRRGILKQTLLCFETANSRPMSICLGFMSGCVSIDLRRLVKVMCPF